jgi:hypothetical protein
LFHFATEMCCFRSVGATRAIPERRGVELSLTSETVVHGGS